MVSRPRWVPEALSTVTLQAPGYPARTAPSASASAVSGAAVGGAAMRGAAASGTPEPGEADTVTVGFSRLRPPTPPEGTVVTPRPTTVR